MLKTLGAFELLQAINLLGLAHGLTAAHPQKKPC